MEVFSGTPIKLSSPGAHGCSTLSLSMEAPLELFYLEGEWSRKAQDVANPESPKLAVHFTGRKVPKKGTQQG